MLLAHAPAGYLVTRILSRTIFGNYVNPQRTNRFYQLLMFAGIIGGIAPDFDFLYLFLIDGGKAQHHAYLTHLPVLWAGVCCLFLFIGKIRKDIHISATAAVFCASAMFHLVLDTLTGVIYWFYPLSKTAINVFKVADVHVWWVHNYIYHWTFLVEIAIILTAMVVFLRVRETVTDLIHVFGKYDKLRFITLRVGICIVGLSIIVIVGSLRFNVDNRMIYKMKQMKHTVVQLIIS